MDVTLSSIEWIQCEHLLDARLHVVVADFIELIDIAIVSDAHVNRRICPTREGASK
jgi:hypothetical protein